MSLQNLSHSVDKLLENCGGVSMARRSSDLPYMGVSASHGEMLLQHGEFPATPLYTPTPRYKSTPFDPTPEVSEESNVDYHLNSAIRTPGLGELTYSLTGVGNGKPSTSNRTLMMTTPENLFNDHIPKCDLSYHQTSPASLQSMKSWDGSEGEGAWPALSPYPSSLGSLSSPTSSYTLPRDSTYSRIPTYGSSRELTCPGNPTTYPKEYIYPEDLSYVPHQCKEPTYLTKRSVVRPSHCQQQWPDKQLAHCAHSTHHTLSYPTHHLHAHPAHHLHAHPAHHLHAHPTHHRQHTSLHLLYSAKDISRVGGCGGGGTECVIPGRSVSPRKSLIQEVVMRESTKAFRSHPLFHLLKDLAVADYYYDMASFNVDKVNCQATKLWTSLESEVGEVEAAVEEMCHKYLDVVRSSTPVDLLHALSTTDTSHHTAGGVGDGGLQEGTSHSLNLLVEDLAAFSPIPATNHDLSDFSTTTPTTTTSLVSTIASSLTSLPSTGASCLTSCSSSVSEPSIKGHYYSTEARNVLTSWLLDNCHRPYPDDDQKLLLMRGTGLSSQQINQWFTNARRRFSPKIQMNLSK
ncbi:Homeobox protein Meis1-like 2 [Homarus americanus]|uniref:Homeobox protein Meis1-like 2 n=1 Tax=Homarus americanus TaxID=6706 RepID=A0A8J5TKG2_HOMAM|nr:Homeobox protein Meis1-like 2 [Homarus americanus]